MVASGWRAGWVVGIGDNVGVHVTNGVGDKAGPIVTDRSEADGVGCARGLTSQYGPGHSLGGF